LQRQIYPKIEDMRNGVDEPHEHDGKQRRAKESFAAEQERRTGSIAERHQGMWRNEDGPGGRKDEFEDGVIAKMNQRDGEGENREAPPGATHLPAKRPPYPEDQQEADERDKTADRFKGIGCPQRP